MADEAGRIPVKGEGGGARPKARSTRRRKVRRRPVDEHVQYALEVHRWDYYYNWRAAAQSRYEDAGYHHLETVTFDGAVVRPEGFAHPKGRVILSAHAGLRSERVSPTSPSLGSLDARDDLLEAYVFVPEEHLPQLVAVAASGRVRYVLLGGTRLKWRHGKVHSVSVRTEVDEGEI